MIATCGLAIVGMSAAGPSAWSDVPGDGCQLLPGDQVAEILGATVGSPKVAPFGADDLKRAQALASTVIANAKASGM